MKITVTIAESHRSGMLGVEEQLRAAGMEIDQVLEALGMITGIVPDEQVPVVEMFDGVASVDRQLGYQLPHPGDEVQ